MDFPLKKTGETLTETQLQQLRRDILRSAGEYIVASGSSNAFTIQIDSNEAVGYTAATISSILTGHIFRWKANHTITDAATLTVKNNAGTNLLSSVPLKWNLSTPLIANDIVSGQMVECQYDGTNMQILSAPRVMPLGYASPGSVTEYGILGENVSASDITNNLNLVYKKNSDGKWYKVTSTVSTWFGRLGLVLTSGVTNDTVSILLKGQYSNQSFSNINPTFSASGSGSNIPVGTSGNYCAAFAVDNTSGAEAVLSGAGSISARKVGTPTKDLSVYLVLEQTDQANTPAYFAKNSATASGGAIIASASIDKATFGASYGTMNFTLTPTLDSAIRIPAKAKVYLVFSQNVTDASNYYEINGSASSTLRIDSTTNSAHWTGSIATCTYSLTVTSTSPIGYSVKAYVSSNGSYGMVGSVMWSRVIGRVLSSGAFYFDPEHKRSYLDVGGYIADGGASGGTTQGIAYIDTGFCPSQVQVRGATSAATPAANDKTPLGVAGVIRGDVVQSSFCPKSLTSGNFANAGNPDATTGSMRLIGYTSTASKFPYASQNKAHCVPMENGFYFYAGFPDASFFIHGATNTAYGSLEYRAEI